MAIDLRNLRHFVATAENGSFRRAANVLHMQQSSVSRAVRQLEDALGVSLFERRVSGAQLTDAGHRLLRDVRPALEQLELAPGRVYLQNCMWPGPHPVHDQVQSLIQGMLSSSFSPTIFAFHIWD